MSRVFVPYFADLTKRGWMNELNEFFFVYNDASVLKSKPAYNPIVEYEKKMKCSFLTQRLAIFLVSESQSLR